MVVWLEESIEDLKEIGRYIGEDDPAAAYRVLIKIKASGDSLEHSPELGRLGRVKKTRELIVAGLPYILPSLHQKKPNPHFSCHARIPKMARYVYKSTIILSFDHGKELSQAASLLAEKTLCFNKNGL